MHYPDEIISDATYWDAKVILAEKRDELLADDDDPEDVTTVDALMELLGLTGGSVFLWGDTPFEVVDDANFSHTIQIEDLNASKARDPYVQQDLEDPEMLVRDWLQGNVKPAKQTVVAIDQTNDNTTNVPTPDENTLPDDPDKEFALTS
ncbi:hypothetical protein [Salinibaculum rarum]|uniref:hypothetical protein n=1 Tax=Salinibaculum rarum TaxID=3058903 RepID=UPI00265E6046|nr:hypothetical protein [Salinibaculum sp. KK48]